MISELYNRPLGRRIRNIIGSEILYFEGIFFKQIGNQGNDDINPP